MICLLSDFGISKVIGTLTDLTKTARGTIFTMSPEVIRREPHNQAADVFSLGCVLYEMCALERAFVGDNREQIEHMVLNSNPPRIPDMYSDSLWRIIKSLLEDRKSVV